MRTTAGETEISIRAFCCPLSSDVLASCPHRRIRRRSASMLHGGEQRRIKVFGRDRTEPGRRKGRRTLIRNADVSVASLRQSSFITRASQEQDLATEGPYARLLPEIDVHNGLIPKRIPGSFESLKDTVAPDPFCYIRRHGASRLA